MKRCYKCGDSKELDQFNKRKREKDGHTCICRTCGNKESRKNNREVMGHLPMSENKECPQYLGIVIAERLVRHLFENVVRMPNNQPGFDFICAHEKMIDVKSACITMNNNKNPHWRFAINKNQTADYFLLLSFNNRQNLDPLHQWLIPGDILNHLVCTTISPSTIDKWDEYRQPIVQAQMCCSNMKGI